MRRLLVLVAFAVAVAGVLAAGALAQAPTRDGTGETSDAQCYGHHREEGFRSMDLLPEVVQEVAADSNFTFRLTIRNPWLHELRDTFAFVNTSRAPGIQFPGARDPEAFVHSGSLPLNAQAPSSVRFPLLVEDNATLLIAALRPDVGPLGNGDFDLFVHSPAGQRFNATPDAPTDWRPQRPFGDETVVVPYADLLAGGVGEWALEVVYEGGLLPTAAFDLEGSVYYNLSRQTELLVRGPAVIPPGGSHTFEFTLIATEQNPEVAMVYGGKVIAHNEHTDPNAQDWGNYTKWATMTYAIGTQSIIGPVGEVRTSALLQAGPAMRAWGEILGFAASFVLLPALVLGGVFGRGSVTAMNKVLGGARRRVLFHNATSYGLLVLSLVHMLVLLLEPIWAWTHGLLLGGIALAMMVALAITGAFQRRLVVVWGFPRWRFVHFFLGVLIVVFVLAHMVVDGTHFEFARQWLAGAGA